MTVLTPTPLKLREAGGDRQRDRGGPRRSHPHREDQRTFSIPRRWPPSRICMVLASPMPSPKAGWKHESGTYVKHPGRRRPVCVRLNAAYSCKSRSSRRSSASSSRIIFAVSPSGYSRARSRHVASFLQLLFSRLGSGRNHTVVFVNAPHTGSIVPTPIVVAPIFRRTL
jgi:hypothetical protein